MAVPVVSTPSLVDPRGPRFAAALTTLVLAAALVTGSGWMLAAQVVVFALGALGRSPYTWLFRRALRPHLAPPADLEDTRPLRFAQAVGLAFAAVGLVGLTLGWTAVAATATASALAAAFLNAAFGVCLGCEAYLLLVRARAPRTATQPTTTHDTTLTEVSA